MKMFNKDTWLHHLPRKIFGWKIRNEEIGDLLFGQQHILTQRFFIEQFGQCHTIPARDFPHYRFLCDHQDDPYSDHGYSRYLACSWDYYYGKEQNTPEKRKGQIDRFLEHYRKIQQGQLPVGPVPVCRRPDGRLVLVDGNHRASIALKLGLDLPLKLIPADRHLADIVAVPDEFYGTKRMARPYQSIFVNRKEVIKGRRPDMYERIQKILEADLRGRSVLDLGCNIGMNCYLAAERGARKVVGVEFSPKIASSAVRLNSFFAAPCEFIAHDLSEKLENIGRFDTVFCFSVVAHLKGSEGIAATIKQAAGKVLYFEGHAHSSEKDYAFVLNRENFSRIEFIGYGSDGIHTAERTRPFFRCEVR
jgi:hypothetical protein